MPRKDIDHEINKRDWEVAFENARSVRARDPLVPGEVIVSPTHRYTLELIEFQGEDAICRDPKRPKGKQIIKVNAHDVVRATDLSFFRRGFNQHMVPVIFPTPTDSVSGMAGDSVHGLEELQHRVHQRSHRGDKKT